MNCCDQPPTGKPITRIYCNPRGGAGVGHVEQGFRPGGRGRGRGVGVGLPPDSADDANTVANIIATQQIRRAFEFMSVCDLTIIEVDRSR